MKNAAFILALAAIVSAPPALAQGKLGTVERGTYRCELPGTASGPVGIRQEDDDFRIISASRYRSPQGGGTYLRRGNTLTMTSGPRNGQEYRIVSRNLLKRLDKDGKAGRMRCLRVSES